jgi:hypothetical protein
MQILTPTGFQKYQRIIKKTGECIKLVFEDSDVTCSLDHRFDNDGVEVAANTLKIGDVLCGKKIKDIVNVGVKDVYSPLMVEGGHKYISNGLVHYNCSFEGSSPTLVEGDILKTFIATSPNMTKYGYDMNIWEEPKPGVVYVMGVDSSTGVGQDFCAFQVLKIVTKELYEQVAVYKNNKIKPEEYAAIVAATSEWYNNCLMVVENNDVGKFVTEELWYNIGCGNVLNTDGKGIGTRATQASKLEACMMLRDVANAKKLILHDAETINQLSRFEQVTPNHFRGAKGSHDDLVSSLYWAIYCLKQPQFDMDAVQVAKPQDDYAPPPCLFDESNDNTDFWKSFN